MNPLSKYRLFISDGCDSCNHTLLKLKENNLNVSTVNIDTEQYQLPFKLMVIPALVKGEKLISYGCNDILASLNHS
ncbi:MAG: hypothetical protein P1U41_03330 [Vicingaceae bacterium]|nr:hypothetical protein [Vicingaceae bacterium]